VAAASAGRCEGKAAAVKVASGDEAPLHCPMALREGDPSQ
jgi:hypothetical protein